jgi:hypothetical protein
MSSCIAVIADSGGSGCQPSLTRAKQSLASIATPKATEAVHPMQHLAPANSARAAEARTTRTRTQLWGPWPTSVQMRQPDSILHRPNGYQIVWAVVLHELGTSLGLDHVTAAGQLMYPQGQPGMTDFGAGDLTGLAARGRGACPTCDPSAAQAAHVVPDRCVRAGRTGQIRHPRMRLPVAAMA